MRTGQTCSVHVRPDLGTSRAFLPLLTLREGATMNSQLAFARNGQALVTVHGAAGVVSLDTRVQAGPDEWMTVTAAMSPGVARQVAANLLEHAAQAERQAQS